MGYSVHRLRALYGILAILIPAVCFGKGETKVEYMPVTAQGRFGSALDARTCTPEAIPNEAYSRFPITVECWARLFSKGTFNILVANEPKESSRHWEIYTYTGSGFFSAYFPGYAPSEIVSSVDVTDGKWHYLAMTCDGGTVRLHVDGKMAAEQGIIRHEALEPEPGPLTFGKTNARDYTIGCDGLVDEVRISPVVREIASVPAGPFKAGTTKLGEFALTAGQTDTCPLFVVAEIRRGDKMADRTFYFTNYEATRDSLFTLPKTSLTWEAGEGKVMVTNAGSLPAVGVNVQRPGHADTFTASDGCFWLDPGESHAVSVSSTDGLVVEAWNTR